MFLIFNFASDFFFQVNKGNNALPGEKKHVHTPHYQIFLPAESGRQAFVESDGIRVLYNSAQDVSDSREVESLIMLASLIMRKCCPRNRLPLDNVLSATTFPLPHSDVHIPECYTLPEFQGTGRLGMAFCIWLGFTFQELIIIIIMMGKLWCPILWEPRVLTKADKHIHFRIHTCHTCTHTHTHTHTHTPQKHKQTSHGFDGNKKENDKSVGSGPSFNSLQPGCSDLCGTSMQHWQQPAVMLQQEFKVCYCIQLKNHPRERTAAHMSFKSCSVGTLPSMMS